MDNGRMMHVLVRDQYFYPDNPAKKTLAGYVEVHADAGMAEIIASVEGVRKCYKNLDEFTYHAYLDPRYSRDVVKRGISKAVIRASKSASEPTPEPAPEVDAAKIRTLIWRIVHNANSWGFHEAMAFDCDDAAVRADIQCIANSAHVRCRALQAELEQLLGIEEGQPQTGHVVYGLDGQEIDV